MTEDKKSKSKQVGKEEHEELFAIYAKTRSLSEVSRQSGRSYTTIVRQSNGGRTRKGKPEFPDWKSRLSGVDRSVESITDAIVTQDLASIIKLVDKLIEEGGKNIHEKRPADITVKDWIALVELKHKLTKDEPAEEFNKEQTAVQTEIIRLQKLRIENPDEYKRIIDNAEAGFGDHAPKSIDDLSSL